MTLPDECPVEDEEDERVRLSSPTEVEFVWEGPDDERTEDWDLVDTELESVELEAPEHTHGAEAFEGSMEVEMSKETARHLLTTTPRGAGKSWVNHHYGRSPVQAAREDLEKLYPEVDLDEPTREDAEAVLAWQGSNASARAEAVRRRREREERELPGHPAPKFSCAHCGDVGICDREGTIERGDDWYCSITCLNAEVNG